MQGNEKKHENTNTNEKSKQT